ncbi:MAG: antitoxin AF2212-like protein [Anaerolineae bacterium]|jgi:predicted DNA-binding antitoxin AbrB/MazE fold protein
MGPVVTAVYKQGALYPLTRLSLEEGETVQLWILESTEADQQDEVSRALYALMAAGLVRPVSSCPDVQPVSDQRRRELAQILGAGGPLSELIMKERD